MYIIILKGDVIADLSGDFPKLLQANGSVILRKNFLKVNVFFQELNYEVMEEVPAYEVDILSFSLLYHIYPFNWYISCTCNEILPYIDP